MNIRDSWLAVLMQMFLDLQPILLAVVFHASASPIDDKAEIEQSAKCIIFAPKADRRRRDHHVPVAILF